MVGTPPVANVLARKTKNSCSLLEFCPKMPSFRQAIPGIIFALVWLGDAYAPTRRHIAARWTMKTDAKIANSITELIGGTPMVRLTKVE